MTSDLPKPAPAGAAARGLGRARSRVVAHPDDMEFGAAAAVARWTGQGKEVTYCMVTSGEAGIDGLAPEECRARCARPSRSSRRGVVGVPDVEFLGLPDGVLEYGVRAARRARPRRTPPPAGDRHHRQLPRHLGRPQPQPGRPHRGRARGRRRGARRRQPLGLRRPARRRARAVGRGARGLGVRLPRRRPTRSTPPTPSTPASPRWRRTRPTSTGWAGRTSTPASSSRAWPARPVSASASPFAAPFEVFPMGWGE